MKDLYNLLTLEQHILDGACVADKVMGKGAAALMVPGKVREVFAFVISIPVLELLRTSGVRVKYGRLTENIRNRQNTGICPVETLCLDCSSAGECLPIIKTFIENLNQS